MKQELSHFNRTRACIHTVSAVTAAPKQDISAVYVLPKNSEMKSRSHDFRSLLPVILKKCYNEPEFSAAWAFTAGAALRINVNLQKERI